MPFSATVSFNAVLSCRDPPFANREGRLLPLSQAGAFQAMTNDPRSRGSEAEQIAARHLEGAGLRILHRNYRCRFGEIDLIAQDGSTLVFVEVRQRSHAAFGGAAASITTGKQRRLMAAARHYLAGLERTPDCRFDAVLLSSMTQPPEWLRNIMIE